MNPPASVLPDGDDLPGGRALQDQLPGHCFGCGSLNPRGLGIKSRWDGDELVCTWRPKSEHIGYPGYVYGGTIASVVDCHAIWAVLSSYCRQGGHDLADGAPPFVVVTSRLQISYLRPVRVTLALQLRARIEVFGERKCTVACDVWQGPIHCATASVDTVRVKDIG